MKKGDFIQIDPGTVHAIKGGVMVLETQQSSDITYRVYDYDRLQNGKPRQLHIEQSLDVIRVPAESPEKSVLHAAGGAPSTVTELIKCPFYTVLKAIVDGPLTIPGDPHFLNMSVYEGEGTVLGTPVKKGDHLILTAAAEEITFDGHFEAILSHI